MRSITRALYHKCDGMYESQGRMRSPKFDSERQLTESAKRLAYALGMEFVIIADNLMQHTFTIPGVVATVKFGIDDMHHWLSITYAGYR